MNQTDIFTNNPSEQPSIIGEMASLKQHLQWHPQREEILLNIQECQAIILKRERDKQ
ncbi:hypothetical protein [Nostoc sp. MS1]|uniref:hypothetical protein n=1 Tax=Nostoc sp. MS1 TaxID=2764711 RepID=UPI001CC5FEF8|nr:hypothetical protein [Nostoc sp. MS1]